MLRNFEHELAYGFGYTCGLIVTYPITIIGGMFVIAVLFSVTAVRRL